LEISFDHSFAGLFILLATALAFGISYLLYYRNSENISLTRLQVGFLAFLRFLSLSLIFIFLLSPIIESTKKIKQLPILAVAIDNSQSVSAFTPSIAQFTQSIQDRLKEDYQLEFWSFGEKVENTEKFSGTDRRSDYGQMIKSLKNNYINKNIGALILLGDGIYNQGQNPENLAGELKFPVYTLGVGDTTRRTDALIGKVKTNKIAFLKNKFPVEIEMKFSKLKNKIAFIDIEHNHKQIYSSNLPINSDDDFKLQLVNLEADEPGMQHYKVKIRTFEGEINLKNNEFEFVIQVLENKQKILMLSDGPHPDLGAISNSLSELQNYDVKLLTGNDFPDSLSLYSLIILNQLPSQKNVASKLLSKIKESRIPVLFLIGPNTLLDQLNSLELGLKISTSNNTEEVQALIDNNFSLFILSDETKKMIETAPPLVSPFGNTELAPLMQNLAHQSIRNIQTSKTLIAFGMNKGRKIGFIAGEGLWRWRLYDYQTSRNNDSFNELVQKSMQYLALKQNEDNFNVFHPALFQETDAIELTAELYNDSYELVNTPDVNIRIKNDSLREFTYQFDRSSDAYRLNAGNLRTGDYTYEAETNIGDQYFIEKGSFSIVKNELEIQNTRADFGVLYQLSEITGGKFFPLRDYGTLLDTIRSNKQIAIQQHQQTFQTEWINLKSLFLLLILLVGVEWFFRKYWGIY
jgi:hypothetical protein